jgi:BMFP domain-containing protein YqiC
LIDFAKTTSFDSKYQKESASVSEILKSARNEVANLRKRILELEDENRKLKGIYFE